MLQRQLLLYKSGGVVRGNTSSEQVRSNDPAWWVHWCMLEPSMMGTYVKYPYRELHESSTLVRAPSRLPKMYQYILGQK
jgi:hypothetical protein